MPGQGSIGAGDETCATLQTSLIIHLDLPLVIKRIQLSWADVQTVLNSTFCLANFVIDKDMGLFINLEDIQT
jgi:hypothetical protein